MSVILVFLVFVVFGDAIAVGISAMVEPFSHSASLFVFLALFVAVLDRLGARGAGHGALPRSLTQRFRDRGKLSIG